MTKLQPNPLPILARALESLHESEDDFLSWVIDYAHLRGWKVHHTRSAWTNKGYRTPVQGDTGFPDLICARGGVIFCMELKSERGKLSEAQRAWITELGTLNVALFRPSDRDRIMEILS